MMQNASIALSVVLIFRTEYANVS